MTSLTRNGRLRVVAGALGVAVGLALVSAQNGEPARAIAATALVGFLVTFVAGWFVAQVVGNRLRPETCAIHWTRRDLGVVAIGFGCAGLAGAAVFGLARAAGASDAGAMGPAAAGVLAGLLGGLFLAHRALNA